MTRRVVYGISLWVFVGAFACTIAAVILPDWLSYNSPSDHDPVLSTYGLFKSCSNVSGNWECAPFPTERDCRADRNKTFCGIWRTTGFLMSFAILLELACAVAYITVLLGGRGAREVGWKVVAPLLGLISLSQLVAMALVAYSFDHDERFFIGWELDKSWVLCTVSWSVLMLNAVGVLSAAKVLPYEDDYEPIS